MALLSSSQGSIFGLHGHATVVSQEHAAHDQAFDMCLKHASCCLDCADRKLALKLHPDKCTAAGSDEAFKRARPWTSDLLRTCSSAVQCTNGFRRTPGVYNSVAAHHGA